MSDSNNYYGATPGDWLHFDLTLGLSDDLLPVVSRPDAPVSAKSKLKALGKTPSRYNAQREVTGIAKWTEYVPSDAEIQRWADEPDYGICLQTRTVRALDIDVPDQDKAQAILAFITEQLGLALPVRGRANSGKLLAAFTLPGEMPKRKMLVDGGVVEFLATGQQFVAIGTHPSGTRYHWTPSTLPEAFPDIDADTFEALWQALADRFAIEPPTTSENKLRKQGEHLDMPDPVADWLLGRGWVVGEQDGALVVSCPWSHEHTTGEDGDGSTVWFLAGSNGYDKGHFRCLHGHCEGRTDGDFFDAVGYVEDVSGEFPDLAPVQPEKGERKPLPAFVRDKQGRIEATAGNVSMAIARPDLTGMDIRHDTFRDEILYSPDDGANWLAFKDTDYVRLRILLEREGFKPIGRDLMRDAVHMVADDNPMDSAQVWLEGLAWDGVPRIERFLHTHFGAADTDYTRAVSRYMWTAMAGRVQVPGIKADMVPVLIGEEGIAKSSSIAALVPSPDYFTEISFGERDEDQARKMRGRLVAEIAELRGLHTREEEGILAFVTRTHEHWVPKYKEFAVTFPRRLVFIGTTNREEFLNGDRVNRRWLPVVVEGEADIAQVKADRLQLWAEAREMFALVGVAYQQAEELAGVVRKAHVITDSWAEDIARWLGESDPLTDEKPQEREFLQIGEVARGALRMEPKQLGKREEMRIGNCLRELGYERVVKWVDGRTRKVWAAKSLPPLTT